MKPAEDSATLRQLRSELDSLQVPPAPTDSVVRRGRAIKGRRRAVAAGAVVAVVAVLAAARLGTEATPPGTVTVNRPNPSAPGGMFASGTADGVPWSLAVRNIDDPGSHRCAAAVMLNGHDGDVLFGLSLVDPTFGNPAILAKIPGLPGVSAMFTQVTPAVTKTVISFRTGASITIRPVRVRKCGRLFHLVGLLYASRRGISGLSATTPRGPDEALVFTGLGVGRPAPGLWLNEDKSESDIAASRAATPIGTGTVDGLPWHITTSLGLFGQCYTSMLYGGGGNGLASRCVPVAGPPRAMDLSYVGVPGPELQFTGYAGPVSPRTARVTVTLSNGTKMQVTPVRVTGRAYLAFVVQPDYWVTRLSLADSVGRVFASVTRMPAPGAVRAGPVPTFRAPSGVVPVGPALRARPGG